MSVKLYFHQVSECNSQKHEGLASSWPQIDRGWQEMKGRSKLQKMKLIFFNMELIKFSQTLWVQRQSENWTLEIRKYLNIYFWGSSFSGYELKLLWPNYCCSYPNVTRSLCLRYTVSWDNSIKAYIHYPLRISLNSVTLITHSCHTWARLLLGLAHSHVGSSLGLFGGHA